MRIVEKCWIELTTGYRAVCSLEIRIKSEWKRAIQVVQKKEKNVFQFRQRQKRKIVIVGSSLFVLLYISLCIAILYFPQNQFQFLSYFCASIVAGAFLLVLSLPAIVSAFKVFKSEATPSLELTDKWWSMLQPKKYVIRKPGDRGEIAFLKSLAFLDNEYIAMWGLLTSTKETSDTDVLLLGPTGIWIFEVKYWSGEILKLDGVWLQKQIHYKGGGLRTLQETYHETGPDRQWLNQKAEIVKTIETRLPSKTGISKIIKGGIVFAHQRVRFGQIITPLASYGKSGAWHKRVKETKPVGGFTFEDRLKVLDVLIEHANIYEREEINIVSADFIAKQLYDYTSKDSYSYVAEYLNLKSQPL